MVPYLFQHISHLPLLDSNSDGKTEDPKWPDVPRSTASTSTTVKDTVTVTATTMQPESTAVARSSTKKMGIVTKVDQKSSSAATQPTTKVITNWSTTKPTSPSTVADEEAATPSFESTTANVMSTVNNVEPTTDTAKPTESIEEGTNPYEEMTTMGSRRRTTLAEIELETLSTIIPTIMETTTTQIPLVCPPDITELVENEDEKKEIEWMMPVDGDYKLVKSVLPIGKHVFNFELTSGVFCHLVISIYGKPLVYKVVMRLN